MGQISVEIRHLPGSVLSGNQQSDPKQAFPGHGQVKPEQQEIDRLRREVAKLKAERDILKKAAAYFARDAT